MKYRYYAAACACMMTIALVGCQTQEGETAQTNFLGGIGEVRMLQDVNTLIMEDDRYFYCYMQRADKQSATGYQLQEICQEPGCMHNVDTCLSFRYKDHLHYDGKQLYLSTNYDNTLYRLDMSGKTEAFLQLNETADGKPVQKKDFSYIQILSLGDSGNYFVRAVCCLENDERGVISAIVTPQTDEILYLSDDWQGAQTADGLLYVSTNEGTVVQVDPSNGNFVDLMDGKDFTYSQNWYLDADTLYYQNMLGQYCAISLRTKEKRVLLEEMPYSSFTVGNGFLYGVSGKELIRAECDGSNPQTIATYDEDFMLLPYLTSDTLCLARSDNGIVLLNADGTGERILA